MIEARLEDITKNITDGKHGDCKPDDNSGYFFISCKDVHDGIVDYSNARQITEEDFVDTHRRTLLEPNDILITNSGTIGRMALVKDIPETYRTTFQKSVAIVKPDTLKVIPSFLYYRLMGCVNDFVNQSNGSAQKNLLLGTMRSFLVSYPEDKETQKKLSGILERYDDLIENNQRQIRLLEETAQRLYKEWFVDFRFPGSEDVQIVDGVPAGWKKRSILENDIFEFVKSPVTPFDGEKHYYATADVVSTQLTGGGELITYINKPSRASVQPIRNSVWFARMSNSYKILNYFGDSNDLADNSVISSGFAGFTSSEDYYGFVYETIASKWFDDEKDLYATGATQVSLTNEGLKRINVLIPSTELIKKYSQIVNPFMRGCEAFKKKNVLLKEARDRLLPKLMSGEIEL